MLTVEKQLGKKADFTVDQIYIVLTHFQTQTMTLRRNNMGQLGFHVQFEGLIADVEQSGFAWQAGLRQGSRLVEVCNVQGKDSEGKIDIFTCTEI